VRRRNATTVISLLAVLGVMAGLTASAVPLYRLFCQVTGYGGTTQVAAPGEDRKVLDRVITVRFNADVNPALPWRFAPLQDKVRVRVGEPALAAFTARSLADVPVTGTATFNVTPAKAGLYFVKTDCFCFTEQTLAPGGSARLPVSFFVDPAIAEDHNLDDVSTITLSYTFFRTTRRKTADAGSDAPPAAPAGGTAN
jgi:cytochrome c oxidase assembly protein subunit 11